MVKIASDGQALRVGFQPGQQVSSPPAPGAPLIAPPETPRGRPARTCCPPSFHHFSLSPLPLYAGENPFERTSSCSAQGDARQPLPLARSRAPCRPPGRCPSRRHACPCCWGRRRARCDRPRCVDRPPCACARRTFFMQMRKREEGPAHRLRLADVLLTVARRPPRAPDTLSSPLPSLSHPSPSFLPSQLTPPSPLTPLVNPHPLTCRTSLPVPSHRVACRV